MTTRRTRRRTVLRAAAPLLALALAGAVGAAPAHAAVAPASASAAHSSPTTAPVRNAVTVRTTGMNFLPSGSLHPGNASLTWVNRSPEAHMMTLARLRPGVTVAQVVAALHISEDSVYPLLADGPDASYGSPAVVGAWASTTVTMKNLAPGRYVMICFATDADGVPHWQMGMVAALEVRGAAQHQVPRTEGTIRLTDRAITLPEGFDGRGTYRVVNTGTRLHAIQLTRLLHGTTLAAYNAWIGQQMATGQPVDGGGGVLEGGIDVLAPGQSAWLTLDLRAGHYGYVSTTDIVGPELPPQHGEFTVRPHDCGPIG